MLSARVCRSLIYKVISSISSLHVYINLSLHADILDPRRWENTYDLIKLYQTCVTHCDLALPYWPVAIGAFFDK